MQIMKPVIPLFLAGMLALAGCSGPEVAPAAPPKEARLDLLFQQLRTAASAQEADSIEVEILHVWARSGSPALDRLLVEAAGAIHAGEYDRALLILDELVQREPEFVEAWNQRAVAHVLQDDYGAAIEDLRHVLALEPRHFAALTGLGHIFRSLGDEESALKAFDAALEVNPHLDGVRADADVLREKLAGVPI